MPLLLLRRLRTGDLDRHGREPDQHEGQCEPPEEDADRPERHAVVGSRRMTRPRQGQQHEHHSVGGFATRHHEREPRRQEQKRDEMRPPTDQRVKDVPAVELPDRHQVERGDEDADPAGEQPGIVAAEVKSRRDRALDPLDHPTEDRWNCVRQLVQSCLVRLQADLVHSDDRDRNREHQPRERPADRDIEHLFPIGDARALKDHGPHRAEG